MRATNALAVDATNTALAYDQRGTGYPRIAADTVDMGAYELEYTPDFVVDRSDDLNVTTCSPAANDCSLRGAINLANRVAGADTITFAADYTITLAGSSLPDVTTEMTITGTGAANTIVQASTCNPVTLPGGCTPATYRVFNVTSAGNLTLDGLTVQHGATSGDGGGVYNNGRLTVTASALSGNAAGGKGGGIFAASGYTLTVTNSTLAGNAAAGDGGGIYNADGSLTMINSTLYGNGANNRGGGINNTGTETLTMINSTVSGNSANVGGGINNFGLLTLNNSIIANNNGGNCGFVGLDPTIRNNLFGDDTCASGGLTAIWLAIPCWARWRTTAVPRKRWRCNQAARRSTRAVMRWRSMPTAIR